MANDRPPETDHEGRPPDPSGEDAGHRQERNDLGDRIATLAQSGSHRLAVAESLTGGLLANDLARAEGSSDWFMGGVVAYTSQVKHDVLNVRPGPVVSEAAARDMAGGVARLLGATTAAAVTGVGGPDAQDGSPPGTVWVGVCHAGVTSAALHVFDGSPEEICASTCVAALEALAAALSGQGTDEVGGT